MQKSLNTLKRTIKKNIFNTIFTRGQHYVDLFLLLYRLIKQYKYAELN